MASLQPQIKTSAEKQVSKLFNASDADVTFVSSDEVLFKINSTYLSPLTSVGFADSGASSGNSGSSGSSEPVHLLESADVLEILFQFIVPPSASRNYRQPSLVEMDPDLIFKVAEAAEKYVVYGAMNICLARIEMLVVSCPVEVLCHSVKHGYHDLADRAAEQTMSLPFNHVLSAFTTLGNSDMPLRWFIFHQKWRAAMATFIADRLDKHCAILASALHSRQVDRNPSSISEGPTLSEYLGSKECTSLRKYSYCCSQANQKVAIDWYKDAAKEAGKLIPKFGSIITV